MWDLTTKALVHEILVDSVNVSIGIAFSARSVFVFSSNMAMNASIYDLSTVPATRVRNECINFYIYSICYNCDDTRIIVGASRGRVHVWNSEFTIKLLDFVKHEGFHPVISIVCSSSSMSCVSCAFGNIIVWDCTTGDTWYGMDHCWHPLFGVTDSTIFSVTTTHFVLRHHNISRASHGELDDVECFEYPLYWPSQQGDEIVRSLCFNEATNSLICLVSTGERVSTVLNVSLNGSGDVTEICQTGRATGVRSLCCSVPSGTVVLL